MKKMILSLMSAALSCTTFAANCVSVKQVSTNYANHQITIAITRTGCTGDATNHRNTVWVFVDYRTVTGTTKGAWTRATISATSAGTVVNSGSSKGAWIYGANGTQTVTLTLSGMPAKYDWCAFATDYPPNVTLDKGVFTFAGNASFVTSTPQTIAGNTIARASVTANSATTFIDASGCPGIGSLYCPYTGSDLYMDLTHLCQQRLSGAQNWEAYIKDTRDNKLYRIVHMPDSKWWLAQNVKYAGTGAAVPGCTEEECGRKYTPAQIYGAWGGTSGATGSVQGICPNGWTLSTLSDFTTVANAISPTMTVVVKAMLSLSINCAQTNAYGWASIAAVDDGAGRMLIDEYYAHGRATGYDCFQIGFSSNGSINCASYTSIPNSAIGGMLPVRCLRKL